MNKKFLSAILFGALMVTSTSTFVSCKDYDDDINGLQEQVDSNKTALESQITSLQTALTAAQSSADAANAAATAAKTAADKAQTAADKAAADIVAAQAAAQAAVATAKAEAIAAAKADAEALLANYATTADVEAAISELAGKIDGIEEGLSKLQAYDEDIKSIAQLKSDLATQAAAIEKLQGINHDQELTAILADIAALQTKANAAATAEDLNTVKTDLGALVARVGAVEAALTTIHTGLDQITSLAIIPDRYYGTSILSYGHSLPTIAFYSVRIQDENQAWKTVASSNTEVTYRVNPSNVDQNKYTWAFINREATIGRAAGDKTDLISIVKSEGEAGSRTFTLNADKDAYTGGLSSKINIVALKAVAEDGNEVYSDYARVEIADLNFHKIVGLGSEGEYRADYRTTEPALAADADITLVYNSEEGLDLKPITEAWASTSSSGIYKALADYDVEGITYEFSLPEEYLANDAQQTNQQWFVELNDGVLKTNRTNLTESLVPAIGRTPIVLVKALIGENVLASAYIKIEIVEEQIVTPDAPDKDAIIVEMGAAKEFEYHSLTSNAVEQQLVLNMSWEDINNKIYGKSGLTSTDFWNKYASESTIKVTTIQNETESIYKTYRFDASQGTTENENDLAWTIGAFAETQQTAEIKLYVKNGIKTENTYDDIEGKGAEYTLTITIPSLNKKVNPDFILVQKFYVKEDCKSFTYNPLYFYDTYAPANATNCIVVKGQLVGNTWKMSSTVSEHFAKLQDETTQNWENIWQYYNKVNNVSTLSFAWATGTTGVTPTTTQTADFEVALDDEMTTAYEVKNMTYKTTLVNGETCDFNYNIVFVNPFLAGTSNEVKVYGNGIGENYGEVAPQVAVIDAEDDAIYTWNGSALALSNKASNTYKVAAPTVAYAFDTENADYKELSQNITTNSTLDVDANGKFTWKNEGSTLKRDYVLPVIATVTFADLSEVKCVINVRLSASK